MNVIKTIKKAAAYIWSLRPVTYRRCRDEATLECMRFRTAIDRDMLEYVEQFRKAVSDLQIREHDITVQLGEIDGRLSDHLETYDDSYDTWEFKNAVENQIDRYFDSDAFQSMLDAANLEYHNDIISKEDVQEMIDETRRPSAIDVKDVLLDLIHSI